MKSKFDEKNISDLKRFIYVEMQPDTKFEFPNTHRKTSRPNMGQITQIAFALKHLTQKILDEQSSSENEEEEDFENLTKEQQVKKRDLHNWMTFCKNRIFKVEKIWNLKLEDGHESSEEDSATDEADKSLDH